MLFFSSFADSSEDDTGRVGSSEDNCEAGTSPAGAWASGVISSDDCAECCTSVSSSEIVRGTVSATLAADGNIYFIIQSCSFFHRRVISVF